MKARAKVGEWNDDKGYGWLEISGGRLFLHVRDITNCRHRPQVGDVVTYELGHDAQGRECAVNVEQQEVAWGFRFEHLFILAVLVAPPALAVYRSSLQHFWQPIAIVAGAMSVIGFCFNWVDKSRARSRQWRISEGTLHLNELLGGWPGAFLAQRLFHHKTSKVSYQVVFWLIVIGYEYAAVDFLLDWKLAHGIGQQLGL